MDAIARLLTDPTNYAVVRLPGRKYPDVVFQGDSLHALVVQTGNALTTAAKYSDDDLNAELEDALGLLSAAEAKLKSVCDTEGVETP